MDIPLSQPIEQCLAELAPVPVPASPTYRAVEVVAGAHPMPLRRVAVLIAFAVATGLAFGSKPLLNWAEALPVSAVSDQAVTVAGAWDDAMTALGLAQPYEAVRRLYRGWH